MRLSNAALPGLPSAAVRPLYDRSSVTPGIVHLGLGAFHRSHQAAYIDDRLAAGETQWGIVGASLRSPDTRDALKPQDGLYTLSVRDSDSEELRVVGSLLDVLVAPESPSALLDRLTDPAIRIVTLTITEKGYAVDLGTGALKRDHADIEHDLAHPEAPRSALGFLTEAIDRRRRTGTSAFTVLSCDNLPQNGKTLGRLLVDFAAERSKDLAAHIAAEIPCPSSMVDRIVPATTPDDRRAVAALLGVEDAWPVLTEPFSQWVVEDRFVAGRPRLEECGVEFVDDVQPFEHMKLRLLNGTHTSMGAVGRLAGFGTVSQCIADPGILDLVERQWREVIPTLSIPADRAHAYTRQLLARYGNRSLHHRTAQIAGDASQKLTPRIVFPIRECLARGLPCDTLVFAVAAWIRSCGGRDEQGRPLPLNDPTFQAWRSPPDQHQAAPDEVVDAFLGLGFVFGGDLPRNEVFTTALKRAYRAIAAKGVLAAAREM